jgi:hypothetical protein
VVLGDENVGTCAEAASTLAAFLGKELDLTITG